MNLAIAITLSRIFLTPLILVLFFSGNPICDQLALLFFVTAVISDGLDGYWARKKNQVTVFGANLDALADKILMIAMLFSLLHMNLLSTPLVFAMFFREMIVDGMRNYFKEITKRFGTNLWGKTKFMAQAFSICFGMLAHIFGKASWLIYLANGSLFIALMVSVPGLIMIAAVADNAIRLEQIVLPISVRAWLVVGARHFSKLATKLKGPMRVIGDLLSRRASSSGVVAKPSPRGVSEPG